MEENTTVTQQEAIPFDGKGGVDQIREIIVGENLRAIQVELENLQKQIDKLAKTLGSFKEEADAFNDNFQQSTSEEFEKADFVTVKAGLSLFTR